MPTDDLPRALSLLGIGETHVVELPRGDENAARRLRRRVSAAGTYFGRIYNVSVTPAGRATVLCRGNAPDARDAILPALEGTTVERQITIRRPWMRDVYDLLPGHDVTIEPPRELHQQSFRNAVTQAGRRMGAKLSCRVLSPGVYTVARLTGEQEAERGPFSVQRAMRLETGQCLVAIQDAFEHQVEAVRVSNVIPVKRADDYREMLMHHARGLGCANAVEVVVDTETGKVRTTIKPAAEAPWFAPA